MKKLVFPLAVGLVILADQTSKFLVRHYMALGQSVPDHGAIRFTYVTNKAGAFSLFTNQSFLVVVAAGISFVILMFYLRSSTSVMQSSLLRIGLGLDLGEAVGNLIDRIRVGAVTDFIHLGAWPVSNLADSSIIAGTALIAWYLFFGAEKRPVQQLSK